LDTGYGETSNEQTPGSKWYATPTGNRALRDLHMTVRDLDPAYRKEIARLWGQVVPEVARPFVWEE